MKKKFLLTTIAVATLAAMAFATDGNPALNGPVSPNTSPQVTSTSYYVYGGYEYASRIKRFHTSYVTFDFYSPVYTEVYWYRYTPYTWGVSIYDDWYYYSGNVSRYNWTSGFGGSYWWGYEPWWGYSPRMGYGWDSWSGPGFSYSVNYYLGRPQYHYPVAYSSWDSHRFRNYYRPVTVINNNTYNYYYGSEKRGSHQGGSTAYNPPSPPSVRRSGFTATGGRSSGSAIAPASSGNAGTTTGNRGGGAATGTQAGTRTGNRSGGAVTGTRGNTRTGNQEGRNSGREDGDQGNAQSENDKEKSNNGLRMGQYRRGVAQPADAGDNGLPRTNNPNVNDRNNPGKEQDKTTRAGGKEQMPAKQAAGSAGQTPGQPGTAGREQTTTTRGDAGSNTGTGQSNSRQTSADRTPARATRRQQVQSTVRSTTRKAEPAVRQGPPSGTTAPGETVVKQGSGKKAETDSEATGKSVEPKKTTTTTRRRQ